MSIEFNDTELRTHRELNRRYQTKRRGQGAITLQINPTEARKLKVYYDEYVVTCQQYQYTTPSFHDFILQFCEIGFFSWRIKNKGK